MTGLLVKIKYAFPGLWRMVEWGNGQLTALRYPRLKEIAERECAKVSGEELTWSLVTPDDVPALTRFLNGIPEERLGYFAPHPFDEATLRRMAKGSSFVMLKVTTPTEIAGYHFLRCFFIGRAFHGLIVDHRYGGKGIGSTMWRLGANIARQSGMEMYATISKDNLPSLNSCRRGCETQVTEQLAEGYLLLKLRPKEAESVKK